MFSRFLDSLFGCAHGHYSFPITVKKGRRTPAATVTGTYVVCLDCGKEFAYDWREMKLVSGLRDNPKGVHALAAKQV